MSLFVHHYFSYIYYNPICISFYICYVTYFTVAVDLNSHLVNDYYIFIIIIIISRIQLTDIKERDKAYSNTF